VEVIVTSYQDIKSIIIPFFQKYPIQGSKKRDYLDFCKAAELKEKKAHLTQEGLDKMVLIKSGMNRGRDHSNIS
jgi:hypothetical protein